MLKLKMFAAARQLAGTDVVELELPEGATVAELRRRLAEDVPALAAVVPQMMFAVSTEYAGNDTPLTADAEVACIPPVSGG